MMAYIIDVVLSIDTRKQSILSVYHLFADLYSLLISWLFKSTTKYQCVSMLPSNVIIRFLPSFSSVNISHLKPYTCWFHSERKYQPRPYDGFLYRKYRLRVNCITFQSGCETMRQGTVDPNTTYGQITIWNFFKFVGWLVSVDYGLGSLVSIPSLLMSYCCGLVDYDLIQSIYASILLNKQGEVVFFRNYLSKSTMPSTQELHDYKRFLVKPALTLSSRRGTMGMPCRHRLIIFGYRSRKLERILTFSMIYLVIILTLAPTLILFQHNKQTNIIGNAKFRDNQEQHRKDEHQSLRVGLTHTFPIRGYRTFKQLSRMAVGQSWQKQQITAMATLRSKHQPQGILTGQFLRIAIEYSVSKVLLTQNSAIYDCRPAGSKISEEPATKAASGELGMLEQLQLLVTRQIVLLTSMAYPPAKSKDLMNPITNFLIYSAGLNSTQMYFLMNFFLLNSMKGTRCTNRQILETALLVATNWQSILVLQSSPGCRSTHFSSCSGLRIARWMNSSLRNDIYLFMYLLLTNLQMLNIISHPCLSSNHTDCRSTAAKLIVHFHPHKAIVKVGLCSTLQRQFLYQYLTEIGCQSHPAFWQSLINALYFKISCGRVLVEPKEVIHNIYQYNMLQIAITLLTWALLLPQSLLFQFRGVALSVTDPRVRATSTYTVFLQRTVDNNAASTNWDQVLISPTDSVVVTFPIEYSTGTAAYVCASLMVNDAIVRTYSCLKSGNQITIRNFITVSTYVKTVTLTVNNVVNPTPGGSTSSFLATIGDDVAVPSFYSVANLIANTFTSCSATFSGAVYGNTTGQLRVTTSSPSQISNSGYMLVSFPFYWQRDISRQIIRFNFNQGCQATQGFTISCVGGYNGTGYPQIKITGIFLDGGFTSDFSINDVLSPITNEPVDLITIQSFQAGDKPVDRCDVNPNGVLERPITSITVTPQQPPYPSSTIAISLAIRLPDLLVPTDTILFDFTSSYYPSFAYQSASASLFITWSQVLGNSLNMTFNRSLTIDQTLTILIANVIAPPSLATYDRFSVSVEAYGYTKMKGNFGLSAIAGTITNISMSIVSLAAGVPSDYTINFVNPGPLPSAGAIRVYFPDTIYLPPNARILCEGIQVTAQLLPNTNCLQLSSLPAVITNPVTLTFTNLMNPSTTSPINLPIEIRTYRFVALHDDIAFGTASPSFTFLPRSTLSCSVSSSSNMTYAVATLSFNISHRLPLPSDCAINIYYYDIDVSVQRGASGDIACFTNNVSQSCTSDPNNSRVVVHVNETQANSTSILVQVSGYFINTRSTKVLSYFMVETYTAEGFKLEHMILPAYLSSVVQPAPLDYFLLYSRDSQQNSAFGSYTFAVRQPQPLYNFNNSTSNTVVLKFPSSLSLQSASCSACSISTSASTATFPVASSFALLTIDNIGNAFSIEPVNSLTATFYMDALFMYSQSLQLDNFITNTQSSILSIATAYGSRVYGASTTVTANLFSVHAQTAIIRVNWSPEFGIAAASLTVTGATLVSSTASNSSTLIRISNPTTPNISLIFSNILLPYDVQSLPTIVTTFTASNYLIAEGYLATWTAQCTMPCLTCSSIPTQCLSCFSNSSITLYTLYDAANKMCRVQCLETQLQLSNTCAACASTCYTCSVSVSNCTSCPANLYLHQSSCIASCPAQYYRSLPSRTCQQCQSPCSTCVSIAQCVTCRTGWFYSNGQCVVSCPYQVTIPDPIDRVCLPCDPSCLACANTTNNCTSCSLNFAMQNGVCVLQCSNNMYIYNFACVSSCINPCSTCLTYANYCLTCQSATPYLYNHTCVLVCPSMYYVSTVTTPASCQLCTQLAIHCAYCLSIDTCLVCDLGYVLFESQCLNYTPSGYANVTGVALVCDNACLTCTNLQSNCTSCRYDYYHNGICILQCPDSHYGFNHTCYRCSSPCNQCTNQTACLSCLPSSGKYYIASSMACSSTCTSLFYANSSSYTCQPCASPCLTCTSLTLCSSCVAGTFLYSRRCITQCPSSFYADSNTSICSACVTPCSTCISSTSCLTCLPSFVYLYPDQCVSNCPPNYVINYVYGICVNCSAPCLVCNQTNCFKCDSSRVLYLGNCVVDCPSNMYVKVLNDTTKECTICPAQCQTCSSDSMCRQCSVGYFWLNGPASGQCVQACPNSRPILSVHGCEPCAQQNCTSCYANNECYQCQNTTILFNGFCYVQCPSGYAYNSTINSCSLIPPVPDNQTTDNNTTVPAEVNMSVVFKQPIPMIFTIGGAALTVFFAGLACCAKVGWPFALLIGAWGLPQIGSVVLAGYAYHLYYIGIFTLHPIYGFVMVSALGLHMFINIVAFCYCICGVLLPDYKYRHWRKSASCLQLLYISFILTLSLLNFKMQNLLYFGMRSTPKLESTSKLRYLAIASAACLVSSITFVTVFILLIYDAKILMLIWLDAIVCIAVSAIFSMLALRRKNTMFEQPQEQGIVLHRRHISSDEFLTAPMCPTQRQEIYKPLSDSKSVIDSSRGDSDSEASSRLELRSSSRSFIDTNSHGNSLGSDSMLMEVTTKQQQQQQQVLQQKSKSRNEISLQCSILSSGNVRSNTSQPGKYYIECEYQEGSEYANMGSVEESKEWDGRVHQVEHFKEDYSLNKGVVLDKQGHRVDSWDIDSNQAVEQQQIGDQGKQHSQVDVSHVLGELQEEDQPPKLQNQSSQQISKQQNQKESRASDSKSRVSISPLLVNTGQIIRKNTLLQWASIGELQSSNINHKPAPQQQKHDGQQLEQSSHNLKYKSVLMQRFAKNKQSGSRNYQEDDASQQHKESSMSIKNTSKLISERINNSAIKNKHDLSKSEMNQEQAQSIVDRFDNSILSAQQGSLFNSQQAEQQYHASQNSVHNGSIDQLQHNDQNRTSQHNEENEHNRDEDYKKSNAIDSSNQSDDDKHHSKQIKNSVNQPNNNQIEDQNQRWEFLLHEKSTILDQSIKHSKRESASRIASERQQQQIQEQQQQKSNNQQPQSSIQKQEQQLNEEQQQYQADQQQDQDYENSPNEDDQLEQIHEVSKDQTDGSRVRNREVQQDDDVQTGQHNEQFEGSLDEQVEYNKNESKQMQYLQSKNSAKRQARPDDHNTFSIKTKRKKRTDPKHKVVVVDNKKFKKLKRQASDLQKEINQGERLKTLIEIEQAKNLSQSRFRSRSREQQIQAIYMRPLPQRKDKN